jgi:hypothetical protein
LLDHDSKADDMIEERDLDAAVAAGIVDAATRERLVQFVRDHRRGAAGPDEEQFRLLTGFNDIFVTIAVGLVLVAVGSLVGAVSPVLGSGAVAAASWGLAEYFTRTRRMALPSIVLLLTFVGAVFMTATIVLTGAMSVQVNDGAAISPGIVAAAAVAAIAAYAHWRRFMVPITVAAGAGAISVMAIAGAAIVAAGNSVVILAATATAGLAVFGLAMWFDSRDRARVTRRTDVAFWLHLLAAPLIIHPVFSLAGLLDKTPAPGAAAMVIIVYIGLTLVALAIDRRALLVSALGYVIYAIEVLIGRGQGMSASFGVTALVIGLFLVLLSAAWRPIRARVLAMLPGSVSGRLPVAAV